MIVALRKAWKAWDPTQMTTLAWWDATNGTYITQAGGSVSQWSDRSGNNRHLIQDNGTIQPTYANSAVTFDGIAQYLYNTAPFMYANGNVSVFVVGAISSAVADSRLLTESNTADNDSLYGIAQENTGDGSQMSVFIRNDAAVIFANHPILSATGAFDNTKKLYVWGDSGSNVRGNFNGGALLSSDCIRSGVMTLNRLAMAAVVRATITWWLACSINEVIVTNYADLQLQQLIEGYLAWKWGIQGSLDASHPFFSCQARVPKAP